MFLSIRRRNLKREFRTGVSQRKRDGGFNFEVDEMVKAKD